MALPTLLGRLREHGVEDAEAEEGGGGGGGGKKERGSITLPPTADLHVHLRDGKMMELVVPTIREGGVDLVYVMVRFSYFFILHFY